MMRLYSFARPTGHTIDRFGSNFVLSPLMNPDGQARVVCFHLAAGEFVGRHEALVGQLFCVVAGQGWVSGSDGAEVDIAAWQAAYWEAGEMHSAGSASGLTAMVLEGNAFRVQAEPIETPL